MLAYIPQYTADVSGVVLGACFVIGSLPALISGRSSFKPDWSAPKVRALACLGVAVGIGLSLLVFALSPHQGGVTDPHDRWGLGTTKSKVIVSTWIFLLTAATFWDLLRELRFLRGGSLARRGEGRFPKLSE